MEATDRKLFESYEIKHITRINGIRHCMIIKEKKHLNQFLKTHDVELLIKQRKAKGEHNIKNWIRMYLTEYDSINPKRPVVVILWIIPCIENKSKDKFALAALLLILRIKLVKLTSSFDKSEHISLIDDESK